MSPYATQMVTESKKFLFLTRSHDQEMGSHSQSQYSTQQEFWVKACTWRIKQQMFLFFKTHNCYKCSFGYCVIFIKFMPGKILVIFGTLCVTPFPAHPPPPPETNTCSIIWENKCAENSLTNHLQLVGKTLQPALQKIKCCTHEDKMSHLSWALPT